MNKEWRMECAVSAWLPSCVPFGLSIVPSEIVEARKGLREVFAGRSLVYRACLQEPDRVYWAGDVDGQRSKVTQRNSLVTKNVSHIEKYTMSPPCRPRFQKKHVIAEGWWQDTVIEKWLKEFECLQVLCKHQVRGELYRMWQWCRIIPPTTSELDKALDTSPAPINNKEMDHWLLDR